ncbi:hypothetical protein [Actinophytocola sp.]|uniref:hypothetical protein n=1 Tax=Actinophytocola sp. TaxID=1872138 RepID=UPI002D7E4A7F|nr:hypothetical protein [Actinophytocola sp.]HET9141701.1 hypothetical protein [Actinophytocola sp.]
MWTGWPNIGEAFLSGPHGRPDRTATNQFAALAELLSGSTRNPTTGEWDGTEQRLGAPLPGDYKSFVEAFGAGTVSDLTIAAPDAPGEWCCGWVPLDPNPDTWGTAAVPPPMLGHSFLPGLSFSAFVMKYLTEPGFGSFHGRPSHLPSPALFTPVNSAEGMDAGR